MVQVRLRVKCKTQPGEKVVLVGNIPQLGAWDPQRSQVELKTDPSSYPRWLASTELAAGVALEFKVVIVSDGGARWESKIPNRKFTTRDVDGGIELEMEFDKNRMEQKGGAPPPAAAPPAGGPYASATQPPAPGPAQHIVTLPPPGANAGSESFLDRIAKENYCRKSWRGKLEMSKVLLEGGHVNTLEELAMLNAYLTWVASGQIGCQEDGGHHRPCAHAEASKRITQLLWQFAARGDAERFIARKIFPSLPSYAEQFTCSVPMTRIRDIAHRGDIPHEMKQEIKHTLQNKLHRCADPGDMITCERILNKVRHGGYSQAFVDQMFIFHGELKEFFNASGLDEQARQVANSHEPLRHLVDKFLWVKNEPAAPFDQLAAAEELRRYLVTRTESEQTWLLLDLEIEKYAFRLLSEGAGHLEHGHRDRDWWQRLLRGLRLALAQSELSGIAVGETAAVCRELEAVAGDIGDPAKSPFAPQRVAASCDRALRICFGLTQQLEDAYQGVNGLGRALNVDGHAVSVFVEAEIRVSVLFQVSKLVQLAMQEAKRAAGLPLWTTIAAGSRCGKVVHLNALSESWTRDLPAEGAIIFCNEASGDEELPNRVRGVVLARDLPVLSHLALRARQLGVVFACTFERDLYNQLINSSPQGACVKLTVEASGSARTEQVGPEALAEGPGKAKANGDAKAQPKKVGEMSLKADGVLAAVKLADQASTAGSKAASSGKLESMATKCGFCAPQGFAVPFGVMRKAVSGSAVDKAVAALAEALKRGQPSKVEECCSAARAAVEACAVPSKVVEDLIAALPKGTERVAVRSSANSEDLEGVSGAGLHDSVLGVDATDKKSIEKAIQQVWGSMFTLRAVQSRNAAGMPLFDGVAMGVLVQPMVSLAGRAYAFIAFSKDVVADDAGGIYLELCVGLGETLASANEPGMPYRLVVRKDAPHAVKVLSLASFSNSLEDKVGGPEHVRVDYSKERLSTDQAFLEELARTVAAVVANVEKGYGVPMDMEGVVLEKESGREVHLVQARPIVEG